MLNLHKACVLCVSRHSPASSLNNFSSLLLRPKKKKTSKNDEETKTCQLRSHLILRRHFLFGDGFHFCFRRVLRFKKHCRFMDFLSSNRRLIALFRSKIFLSIRTVQFRHYLNFDQLEILWLEILRSSISFFVINILIDYWMGENFYVSINCSWNARELSERCIG